MQHYHYERLSAQDNDFLLWESPSLMMHGSGVMIFEAAPLRTAEGGIDFETIKRGFQAVLHHVPRYRQKLAWFPADDRAYWVDDAQFNIDYHVRHIALPRPGSEAQLKRLAADIMERPLDRGRPLWETWVIEGLDGDRFALVSKTHHCMIDGASAMGIMERLYSMTPQYEIREAPRFVPRPRPTNMELRRDAWQRRLGLPGQILGGVRELVSGRDDLADELGSRLRALGRLAALKLSPASETPINGPVGPHRIFDWLELDLEAFKAVRRACDCSINDVVLGTVTGAVRELMIQRQVRPEDLEFRVSAPVNVRPKDAQEKLGNHVSSWIIRLPLEESCPLEQVRRIRDHTRELKESRQASGVEMITALREWLPFDMQGASKGTQNMLVTNVPGPPFPLYFMGAKALSLFAQAPLIEHIGLAVSAVSYDGKLGFGFNADYDRVPDLAQFAAAVARSFEALAKAAATISGRAEVVEVASTVDAAVGLPAQASA